MVLKKKTKSKDDVIITLVMQELMLYPVTDNTF